MYTISPKVDFDGWTTITIGEDAINLGGIVIFDQNGPITAQGWHPNFADKPICVESGSCLQVIDTANWMGDAFVLDTGDESEWWLYIQKDIAGISDPTYRKVGNHFIEATWYVSVFDAFVTETVRPIGAVVQRAFSDFANAAEAISRKAGDMTQDATMSEYRMVLEKYLSVKKWSEQYTVEDFLKEKLLHGDLRNRNSV